MTQPYRRVVVMHVTIIIGAFLTMALHLPEAALIFLVLLKTAVDLWGHQNEREKSADAAKSALHASVPPASSAQGILTAALQQRALRQPGQADAGGETGPRRMAVLIIILLFMAGMIGFMGYEFVTGFIMPFLGSRQTRAVATLTGPVAWQHRLAGVDIPQRPAAGKFRGEDYLVASAAYASGKLSLRAGSGDESRYLNVTLNLSNDQLAGRHYDLSSDGTTGLPEIVMSWRGSDTRKVQRLKFSGGYALKLLLGQPAGNKVPGKIYLCLPDKDKSFVAGTFLATMKKAKKSASADGNEAISTQ
jgi:hypothetical protein